MFVRLQVRSIDSACPTLLFGWQQGSRFYPAKNFAMAMDTKVVDIPSHGAMVLLAKEVQHFRGNWLLNGELVSKHLAEAGPRLGESSLPPSEGV
ncbi:MAG: hypothetical protein KJZ84_17990 [Bryobacteraceae bacterium]|nr:hypothetical protein [Bryobacteraceae bacterium]